MTQFKLSLVLLAAISIHSIALTSDLLTTNAAPIPIELPEYGIITLPNGVKYMFAKITDAPNYSFNQWGTLANGNNNHSTYSSATAMPSIATPGQASLGSSETTNSITNAAMTSLTNSTVSMGKQTLREKSGIIAASTASTAATAVTAATVPVLGPLAPFAGMAAGKVTESVVENVVNRCTEANASATCFLKSKESNSTTNSN
jgi:hypothetical protein